MDWKQFEIKYAQRETWAFEQLAYLLFCAEHNNRVGLFRYKNQAGIETEPIEKEGKQIGFQAKYYSTSIASNKKDIIDSIKKTKAKNSHLDILYLYVNLELSESSQKGRKKAKYQEEIEQAAANIGITLEWRVPSYFELQLSLPENQYIYDIFFNNSHNTSELPDDILEHNRLVLKDIQTEIRSGNISIRIDRGQCIQTITDCIAKKINIVISGEGGCGKTAVLKNLYEDCKNKFPICIFKAGELNVQNINNLFNLNRQYTFKQFIDAFKDEPLKVFVIDSAEKIAEHASLEVHKQLIIQLKDSGWTLMFTTRNIYVSDLTFHLKESFGMQYDIVKIPTLTYEELRSVCDANKLTLPSNKKFTERLRNLFFLNEFVRLYPSINKKGNYQEFIGIIWKKRIRGSIKNNNLDKERERCLLRIAQERSETGLFYINTYDYSQPALFALEQDEIISYDEPHDACFISHDIYEELALQRIVQIRFNNSADDTFFAQLGNSLIMRRAFRMWLSDKLADSDESVYSFILSAFSNNNLELYWRDEIIISVLLSDYSESFIERYEKKLEDNDFFLLKRVLFLLRIACADLSLNDSINTIAPKGQGWDSIISRLHSKWEVFVQQNLSFALPVLKTWVDEHQNGDTCRHAALLALNLLNCPHYLPRETEDSLHHIIFKAAATIKTELEAIFETVLKTDDINHDHSAHIILCEKILEQPYNAANLINLLPDYVIKLCYLFWLKPRNHKKYLGGYQDSMESRFGLNDSYASQYFPASANQTPLRWLFLTDPKNTLSFIIDFTDKAVAQYSKSDYGISDINTVHLHVDGETVHQYFSDALWQTYRGSGSPVIPYLLQSMHMALEEHLLAIGRVLEPDMIENILMAILRKTHSASISAVICSVVLAYPDSLYRVAQVLFKTIEFFHADSLRCRNEAQSKLLYSIGYGINKINDVLYTDERLKTCENKHRQNNLESLFLNYQLFGVSGFNEERNSQFIGELYQIIDNHKANKDIYNTYGILIARMDRRNLSPKVSNTGDGKIKIEFEPKKIDDNFKKQSEEAQQAFEDYFKYSSLRLWGDFIHGGNDIESSSQQKAYDYDPLLALKETKRLVEELKHGRASMNNMDYTIPPFVCSKIILHHSECLSEEERLFCKEIIDQTLAFLFSDNYDYQISDGVEAAIHALPALISLFPNEKDKYVSALIMALLDETPIGQYKRICDYVTDSVERAKLWEKDPKTAKSILYGYIAVKPLFEETAQKLKTKEKWRRVLPIQVFNSMGEIQYSEEEPDMDSIGKIGRNGRERVLLIIPSATDDSVHKSVIEKMLPSLALELYHDEDRHNYHYSVQIIILRRIALFLLNRKETELEKFLSPFIGNIQSTEESSRFITELVAAEDQLQKHDTFWKIWYYLLPAIVKTCNDRPLDYRLSELVINYLLAWRFWIDNVKHWHSLSQNDICFYNEVSQKMARVPACLYSISRVLNTIGYYFKEDGIKWLYNIVSSEPSIELRDLESATIRYIEEFMRRVIFENRMKIKTDCNLKNSILSILSFIIERGSMHGYLLRESIL